MLQRNRFISNTASLGSTAFGGALAVLNAQATLEDSVLISNTAVMGGGIYIGGSFEDCCNLAGNNNLVQANFASQGGGIYNDGQSIDLSGSVVISNTAAAGGGGFLIAAGGSISLTNSAAIANIAGGDGGAILNSGVISISNTTLSANYAGGMGGGIANQNLANLTSTTVSDNTSADGAGLFNANTLVTLNSLIALNVGNNCLGGLFSLGHNLEDGGTCALGHPTDMSNTPADLGELNEYGGWTLAHPLAADSPAIDAGDNAACAPFDQRGVSRPIDGDGDGQAVCDIGAYEYQLPVFLPLIFQN